MQLEEELAQSRLKIAEMETELDDLKISRRKEQKVLARIENTSGGVGGVRGNIVNNNYGISNSNSGSINMKTKNNRLGHMQADKGLNSNEYAAMLGSMEGKENAASF